MCEDISLLPPYASTVQLSETGATLPLHVFIRHSIKLCCNV